MSLHDPFDDGSPRARLAGRDLLIVAGLALVECAWMLVIARLLNLVFD